MSNGPPPYAGPDREIRLHRGDIVISVWLPIDAQFAGEMLSALAALGFELSREDLDTFLDARLPDSEET